MDLSNYNPIKTPTKNFKAGWEVEAELGIITWKTRDKELSPIFDKIRYYKHILSPQID
jgi:hypothetical protein